MGGKRDFIQNMGGIDLKKITPLLIGLVLLLVACGSGELDNFVEDFNQSARKYDATELKENEFGEVETEDGEDWRNLFESKEYLIRSEEHTSELQSRGHLVCRLLLEKKK